MQGGADLQGAALSGERESQFKFVPAEVAAKIISSPPGGHCALAENRGWVHCEPTRRAHSKGEFKTEKMTNTL